MSSIVPPLKLPAASDPYGFREQAATGNGHAPELIPWSDELLRFSEIMFKHADRRGRVEFRAFGDDGNRKAKALVVSTSWLDDIEFVPLMMSAAQQAANFPTAAVFATPVCTFKPGKGAKADDLLEGLAISVECDEAPEAAKEKLQALLGPATVVTHSGGEWVDPTTGEVQPKAHIHYRLKVPARSDEEHVLLYEARELMARLVGGDPSNNSIVHPIRWPGSWHRKGQPRLARMDEMDDTAEVDLAEALDKLRDAAGVYEPRARGDSVDDDAPAEEVGFAIEVIPNPDLHWAEWLRIIMAIYRATEGSEAGLQVAHAFSRKSAKYSAADTDAKWAELHKSPPTRIGAKTLFWLASQVDRHWWFAYVDWQMTKVDLSVFLENWDKGTKPSGTQPQSPFPRKVFEYLDAEDILDMPDPVWLIDDMVIEQSFGFIYGPPGCLKTFIALNMALSFATAQAKWWGRDIRRSGAVIYIASEGVASLKFRLMAWERRYRTEVRSAPFYLLHKPINFMKPDDVTTLLNTVDEIAARIAVPITAVFVDTVSRVLPGAEENLQKDMTLFVGACDAVRERFNAAVFGIHHTNKEGGFRGSNVTAAWSEPPQPSCSLLSLGSRQTARSTLAELGVLRRAPGRARSRRTGPSSRA